MAYKVAKGDTLSAIARKYKTTVANIMKLNPSIKNANKISIGQSINLTGQSSPTSAPPTPSSYISDKAIKDASEAALNAKLDGINLAANGQKAQYVTNLKNAYANYQDQRNEAETGYAKNANILREKMANMGLGASGGAYQNANTNLGIGLRNNLNSVNLAQQQYANQQNQSLQGINTQRMADTAAAKSDSQTALQEQLANQANQNLSFYSNLYANKNITKDQFKKHTGFKF